jgi:FkbM family methyltransferase
MENAGSTAKQYVPEFLKVRLKRAIHFFRNRNFKPYIKKKNVEGVLFDFWIGDPAGRDWYDLQCTDPAWPELKFLKDNMIQPGDVILECGAHHGCSAIVLSHWVGDQGKVIAFEPLPANAEIIRKNLEMNGIENVTLEAKAVGATSGKKVRINQASNSSVTAFDQGIEVELTCLDEYEHANPTFLKLDVEGFEAEVLRGAQRILRNRPKLAIEVHTEELPKYGTSVQGVLSLIDLQSYEWWIQWDDDRDPEPYSPTIPITRRVHLFGIPRHS